jgi:single-strand DNA-binding protein
VPDNTVTVVGNLTRDPELRFTAGGHALTNFGIAVNRRWQNRITNEWEEDTSFFNVVAWRELAENIAESLTKGARVMVTGRLEQRSWETPEGEKRSSVEIAADDIGPSLRWAKAKVMRLERNREAPGYGSGSAPAGSGSAPAGSAPAGSGSAPAGSPPAQEPWDEEPF